MSNRRNGYDTSSEDETTNGYSFDMQMGPDGNPIYIETRRAPDGSYIRTTRRTYVEPPRRAPPPPPRQREARRPEGSRRPSTPPRRPASPPRRRPSSRGGDRFGYDEYRRGDSEEERRRNGPIYSDDEDYGVRYDANNRRGQFPAEGPGRVLGEVDGNGYIVPAENEPRPNGNNGRRPSQALPRGPLPGPALNDLSESEEEVVVTGRPDGNGYQVYRRRTRPNNDRHRDRRNGRH